MEEINQVNQEIKRYYEVNERSKQDKDILKTLGGKLKSLFKIGEKHTTEDGYELSISSQTRTSMNQETLVEILKQHGFTDAIKTVEVPDDKAVEELMYSGKLTAKDISPAVSEKQVPVLKVKWKGEKKNAKTAKAVSKETTTKDTF